MIKPTFGLEEFALSVGVEALRYEHYYKKHGVRTYQQLMSPRFSSLENLELPLKSVLHYIPESSSEIGIMPTHVLLRKSLGMKLINHVTEYVEPEGSPIPVTAKAEQLKLRYRKAARGVRPLREYKTAFRNDRTVTIEDYCLIGHLYRYRNTAMMRVFMFRNMLRTVIANLNRVAELSDRKQFIELRMPKLQLTLQKFVIGARKLNRGTMKHFPDDQSLLLLELWKWIGDKREESLFSALSPAAIQQLQFVLIETGKYSVLSLDLIEGTRANDDEPRPGSHSPRQVQIAFSKFLNRAYEIRNMGDKDVIEVMEDEDGNPILATTDEDGNVVTVDDETTNDLQELDDLESVEYEDTSDEDIDIGEAGELAPETQIFVPSNNPVDNAPAIVTELSQRAVEESAKLVELGLLSQSAHTRNMKLANTYKTIPNPWGLGTLEDAAKVDPAVLKDVKTKLIDDIACVMDKSMLESSLKNFDKRYVEKVLHADIVGMVLNIQRAGYCITGYHVDEVEDANNAFDIHVIQITTVTGKASTVRIPLPKIRSTGTFRSRGVNYRMKKQRVDIPIRKTSPDQVGLTSYVSKVFVERSGKVAHDYSEWLRDAVGDLVAAKKIVNAEYGDVFDHSIKTPRAFSALANSYISFDVGDIHFNFNMNLAELKISPNTIKQWQALGVYPCGTNKSREMIFMDEFGMVLEKDLETPIGHIEELLGVNSSKAPVDMVTVKVLDKNIPIGVIFAYHYGFTNYIRSLNVRYRAVARGSKLNLTDDEFTIAFADQTIIMSRFDQRAAMAMSGFNAFKNSIVKYNLMEFDSKDVYGAVFDQENMGGRYLRELEITNDLWVDPITRGILIERQEPIEWLDILKYSLDLLTDDTHPREGAGSQRRTRGYERVAGHVYSEMVRSVRRHKTRHVTSKAAFELNPNAVWMNIQKDTAVGIVNELNPVEELKETENMTFSGTGGRSARTMVHSTRAFDPDDLGMVSEAGVDNSNVAVTTYSPPDPNYADLRGMRNVENVNLSDTAKVLSTTALLSPCIEHDDMKRAVFAGVQQSHVTAAVGYQLSPVLTGYEVVVAHRTGPLYSCVAESAGTLVKVTKDHIVIDYDDPDLPSLKFEIGRRYGTSTGHEIVHDIICDVAEGTKLKAGHVVAYNSGFFARSVLDKTQVFWKTGFVATVALLDDAETHEDSCALSERLATNLHRHVTDLRPLTLQFNQSISNMVNVGDTVDMDSILCSIEDSVTGEGNLFDDETRESLKLLARNTPKAKTEGVIGRIEVLYTGDIDDMSDSLRAFVMAADKERTRKAKSLGSKVLTGKVSDLDLDTVSIRIYIDRVMGMGDADKVVFGNQLKSVPRRIMTGVNETVSGIPIDAKFGITSVDARIVGSPGKMGTAMVLVELSNARAAAAYRS